MNASSGLVVYKLDRNPSGIGQYTQMLLGAFKAIGYSPLVLRSGGGNTGEKTIQLPGARLLPALMTIGQAEIGWYARKYGLGLVHDPTGTVPLMLMSSKRVVTIHDVLPLSFPGYSTLLDTLIYRYWLPAAVKRVDAVITDSVQSKRDIQHYLRVPEEKIEVVQLAAGPNFKRVDEVYVANTLKRHAITCPYLLYVGSEWLRKNLLRLLQAYIELRKWSSKWRLVIVGDGNYWKSGPVAQMVEQNGLQGSVTFAGYVPDEDLLALYNGADLFCFPSLYEGFGLPVLEAMACGTPVVTSNISSLPEVAGDAALLVDPHNVDEITAAMRCVLEDPAQAQDLQERGLRRTRQFSWEKTARETIAVYEKVLGEKII